MRASVPASLIALSRHLGDPAREYAILGEGNTSCVGTDGTFWVKASGSHLGTAKKSDFVQVHTDRVLAMLENGAMSEQDVLAALRGSKVDGRPDPLPSVETVVHAVCLSVPGVRFVGHTHPTAINAITCSRGFEKALRGRLFPDQTVLCGPASVLVPYVDPGLALAHEILDRILVFMKREGDPPRTMYLQNHGFVALGTTAKDVMHTTAMADKAARIQLGTAAFGGARFMAERDVKRIHNRLDEDYRRKVIGRQA